MNLKSLLLSAIWLCLVPLVTQADITLVQDGQNPCPIVLPPAPAPLEQKAAEQLARYLKDISGATFPIVSATNAVPDRAILIGLSSTSVAATPAASGQNEDGYSIKTDGQHLCLVGNSPPAALYAVYGFLEDVLGCKWWSHSEEQIPKQTTIEVKNLDLVVKPAFPMHDLYNREAQNDAAEFKFKSRATSSESFTGNHTLYPLLTPYAKTHPEIYPLDKGERKANNLHFCYMAEGIAQALAAALEKQVQTNKGDLKHFIYFAGMGDWFGGMCQCPVCTKIYEEETWTDPDGEKKPGYSATLLRMINRTAEILDQKYPGIRVGTFAYMSLEAPPAKTVPRDNVLIWIPRLRHCTVHPAETCEKNRSYLRNVQRWCELAPNRVAIWEYGASFKNFIHPFPCLRSMAENIRLYGRLGVRGIMIQGNYVTTGSDLVVLKNYVWRKLLWNPALDTEDVIREFCQGYYGPAAAAMLDYVRALDDAVRVPAPIHADEFATPDYLTSDARNKLREIRARAVTAAGNQDPFLRRVKEGTVGVESLALCQPGPLEEQDGKLIRKDLGEDTFPRAVDLLASIRDSGPTEWGPGGAYWINFLLSHGGPLVKLSTDNLEVQVAPSLNGQIYQVTFQGKPILRPIAHSGEKGYPFSGGSVINAGSPILRVAGTPLPFSVTLDDATGIANRNFNAKPTFSQTIALETNGTLVVTAASVAGAPGKNAAISTVYAKATPANVHVQYRTSRDLWENLEISGNASEIVFPRSNAIRLTFLEGGYLITDSYTAGKMQPGKLIFNKADNTLTTLINTAAGKLPAENGNAFLIRKFEISAIPPVKRE